MNNLVKILLRIPPVLWFLLAGGMIYLDYSSWSSDVYDPLKQQLEASQAELTGAQNEIQRASEFVRQRDEKIRELQALGQKLEDTRRELPASANIPDLLESLANISDQTGLEFSTFKPDAEVRTPLLVETPVNVTLKGTYLQIMSFLDAAANMTRVVAARKLTLDTPIVRGSTSIVTASATLITYHLDDQAMAASAAASASAATTTAPAAPSAAVAPAPTAPSPGGP